MLSTGASSENIELENNSDEDTCYIPVALAFTGDGDTGIKGQLTDKYWWRLVKGATEEDPVESTSIEIQGFRPENVLSYSDLLKKYINLDSFVFNPYQTLSFLG